MSIGSPAASSTSALPHALDAGAVAVFGDRNAGRLPDDERGHRGDVDRVGVVAAGADDVDDERQPVLDVQAALAHRARRADDLVDALALRGERGQQRRGLRRRDRCRP